ncbi:MAG: 50S ribosomal protein L11 methyltransferase [Akkermansia sp.]|nr:50S ribosomal protein L11 methyltransferase [Akkermansia sp.]
MWLWSKHVPAESEGEWQERLSPLPGFVLETGGTRADRISLLVYTETEQEALLLKACYGGRTEAVEEKDWVAATAPANTPPLHIRDRLILSTGDDPETLAALRAAYPGREVLSFPAEMAFGTGNHATTATCLRMMCDWVRHRREPWTLADIGCGTGVLALAGMRLGAQRALAFDFDPTAVEIAQRNVARNGGAPGLTLFRADVFEWTPLPEDAADLVLANLFSTVLQRAFPKLKAAMKPDGVLIISGILNTQAEETLAAAEQAGLRCLQVKSRGKWTTAQLVMS